MRIKINCFDTVESIQKNKTAELGMTQTKKRTFITIYNMRRKSGASLFRTKSTLKAIK